MSDQSFSRRHVLGTAAVVGAGGAFLAACGGDEGSSGGGSAADQAPDSGSELAATDDVPVGGGTVLGDQEVVLTQPSAGTFKAFSAVCTHQACLVTDVTETINCSCHGSKFSVTDGSVTDGPAEEPLPEIKVSTQGGTIVAT